MAMSVFRIKKTKDYTVMSNDHLRNKELSLKAKGLLSLMLSLPDEWDYSLSGLVTLSRDGRDSVTTSLDELMHHGYVRRKQSFDAKGRFSGYDYDISEKPFTENPNTGKPFSENHPQLNTKESNTKESNTKNNICANDIEDFFETLWKAYPKKKGKGQVSFTQKRKLYKLGQEQMLRTILRYKNDIKKNKTADKYIKNGSTFFNSGYVDYLDENYEGADAKTYGVETI